MISEEQVERLNLATVENDLPLWDVVIEGKEWTALLFEASWYLAPVNFKFGDETHPGQPFLEMDPEKITVVSEDYLKSLPKWDFDHVSGKITHEES